MEQAMLKGKASLTLSQLALGPSVADCSGNAVDAYSEAASRVRAALGEDPGWPELIRFATLAANGHNTQPWRFIPRSSGVSIVPDFSRRTPVADPDDHHLFVSLGCAAENLFLAARAHGRLGVVSVVESGVPRVEVDFDSAPPLAGDLYAAIPSRQSTRSEYNGAGVPVQQLERLETAAAVEGVTITLITDEARREQIAEFVIAANSIQLDNPDFVRELGAWVRFHPSAALRSGDGLFTGCSGNPTMPDWLGRRLFPWILSKRAENDKYAKQVRSSAGIAVFVGDREDKAHWVRVGRSFERFALQATALGIRHAHLNQAVEAPSVRAELACWLGAHDRRPDLVVRIGYAKPLPMSLRRPVEGVIEPAGQHR